MKRSCSFSRRMQWTFIFALLLSALATALPNNGNSNGNGPKPSLIPPGGAAPKQQPETSRSDLASQSSSSSKKNDVSSKKKPTNSSKSSTTTKKVSATPASDSLRRIKKEYKDAVQMGIAYDWVRQKRIQSKKINENVSEEHRVICLGPLATNLRHWHFSFRGCGIYEAGIYHGRILLPKNYPLTPPRVQVWTPSGRFVPYADICLSASAYHPESWTPRWNILSLVQALRLHMLTNPQEIGSMNSNREDTLEYARKSLVWRVAFKGSKTLVIVDHAQLREQGLFSTEVDEEEVGKETDSISSDNASTDSGTTIDKGDNKAAVNEESEADSSGYIQHQIDSTDPVPAVETPQISPDKTAVVQVKQAKRKKSSKKSGKTSTQAKPGHSTLTKIARRQSRSKSHVVVVVISKLFSSPARIAVTSLVLLLWLLSIP